MNRFSKQGEHHRIPASTPLAHSVRAALAISATALALSIPNVGLAAGSCIFDAGTNTYACDGAFTQSIPDSFVPPADLTLVLGGELPTSVIPLPGEGGVEASWSGAVSIISAAGTAITTSGADGIDVDAVDGTAMVANYGSVDTDVTAADARALQVYALDDITVVNGGDLSATAVSGSYDVVATDVSSIAGYAVGVYNQASGTITASALGGNATAVSAQAQGYYASAQISNEGVINADSVDASATGIVAEAIYGYAAAQNSGSISVSGYDRATGISANGDYGAVVYNNGHIRASTEADTAYTIAYGAISSSQHRAYLTNAVAGVVEADAYARSGDAVAAGLYAQGWEATTLYNYGSVTANAISESGSASALASVVNGNYTGTGLLINGGDLHAEASAGLGGEAYAAGANVYANVASIFNDASSTAIAVSDGGTATAKGARANGIYAAVSNYGDLIASATADGGSAVARGIDSAGYDGSQAYNAGDIQATSSAVDGTADATGIYSLGYSFGGTTDNQGTISVRATGETASGRGVLNVSAYIGDAVTTNAGSIDVSVEGDTQAAAFGIYNYANIYSSMVDNSGTVSVSTDVGGELQGSTYAMGVLAVSSYGHGYGEASVANTGSIGASASIYYGVSQAWGAVGQSVGLQGAASIENDGSISGYAYVDYGAAFSTGGYVTSTGGTSQVVNNGDISATARASRGVGYLTDYAYATGVKAASLPYYGGEADVTNYGDIQAHARVYGGIAEAKAIDASGMYVKVTNAVGANITATGDADLYGGGFASGIQASAVYGIDVVNDGAIGIYSHARGYTSGPYDTHYGSTKTMGIYAGAGMQGSVSVVNNGDIVSHATSEHSITFFNAGAGATGVQAYAKYEGVVDNTGTISSIAISELGISGAYGAMVHGKYYSHMVNEADASIEAISSVGSLSTDQYGGRAVSFGTEMFGATYAVTYNAGSIVSHATSTPDGGPNPNRGLASAYGSVVGSLQWSPIQHGSMVNLGDIEAVAQADDGYGSSYGVMMVAQADATLDNSGSIRSSARADGGDVFAVGSLAYSVHAYAVMDCNYDNGYRMCDYSNIQYVVDGGKATVDNKGDIAAAGRAHGGNAKTYGVVAVGGVLASVTNAGHITARVDADRAMVIGTLANSFEGQAALHNDGIVAANATGAQSSATGVSLMGSYGTSEGGYLAAALVNLGDITALASGDSATAIGALLAGRHADGVQVDNNGGTIAASAYGADATSTGLSMDTFGNAALANTGTIVAVAKGDAGATTLAATASGANAEKAAATGVQAIAQYGDVVQIDNTGAVSSAAYGGTSLATAVSLKSHGGVTLGSTGNITAKAVGDEATANGIEAIARGAGVQVDNSGKVVAEADGAHGTATTLSMDAYADVVLTNGGTIAASSQGDGATAVQAVSSHDQGMLIDNAGTIAASADGPKGAATALSTSSYGALTLTNGKTITASGNTRATGVNAVSSHDDGMQIGNTGTIAAVANAAGGIATALTTDAYGNIALTNGGSITASSKGDGATAVEAITSHGDGVRIDNAGTITAAAYGAAASVTAISMASQGTATLHNTGTIAALGNGNRVAIASGKDASASIFNGGMVDGAIDTGDRDDSFENAQGATWRLAGSSDFGAGDDHIVNHGTMYMGDAQLLLGSYAGGNMFENTGTLVVAGSGNVIDMDNPFPIVNDGVIDMANGHAGDALSLVGDLDGTGTIRLDASGLDGRMDQLNIQGRVFDSARQTLDINLLDLPAAATARIPLLQASGNVAGGFTLGSVRHSPGSFLTLDVSLHEGADPQDAARRLLSLDVDVSGLSGVGSTAAAIAPGVQSLVDAQVGTWRQRVGVLPESNDARLSPWVRTFSGSGDVDLGHAGNFGGGGAFGFRQSNHGLELGVDTRLSSQVSAGVLIGTSEGTQHLRQGAGSDRFDSRSVGFYATWRAGRGFYLDLSQRWNSVDARLRSGLVDHMADASASTFNLESGFTAWQSGRVHVVPQIQYTHTRVGEIDPLHDGSSRFAYAGGGSSRGRLGVSIDGSFQGAGFVWTPYGSINVVRAFSSDYSYQVNDAILGSVDTEGTSTMVEAGLGVRKGKLSLTGGVSRTDGGALRTVTGAQFTVRYDW
jgi:hypothetical protein